MQTCVELCVTTLQHQTAIAVSAEQRRYRRLGLPFQSGGRKSGNSSCTRGTAGVGIQRQIGQTLNSAARILPLLNYPLIRDNPKVLLGFSDITALHNAIQAQTGLVAFHGPNASASWNTFNVDQFQRVFFERELMHYQNVRVAEEDLVQRQNRTITISSGKARGELIGGNLTVLTALAGSPYLPDFSGKILFLEDVEEAPYRIDRMLSTLKLMGAPDKIAGFMFGACVDCRPIGGYGWLTMEEIFNDHIKPLNIPAYRGTMIGHIR